MVFFAGMLFLASCGRREAKDVVDALPVIFPDYVEVTVPSTIAPLNFEVRGADHVVACLTNGEGDVMHVEGEEAICMDETEWKSLIGRGGDVSVKVSVWDDEHPDGATYRPFTIHVSNDSIDPWITYRLLPPGYEGWNKMGIYQRELSSFEELTLIDNAGDRERCMNCHTTCNGNPDFLTYHMRGKNGYTYVSHNGKEEKVDLRKLTGGRHGSHNAWHPTGKFIAFSSNDTKQVFFAHTQDKIEVFDLWSDLFIYDVENHKVIMDDRFADSLRWESEPCFSPDGRWLYFSTARPVHLPQQYADLHYDLVRVPFDEATGQLGHQVDTLYSTSQRGGTALMPRVSPDGRFLLYTIAECGAFNLYHREADFEMLVLDTTTNEARFVDCSAINSEDAESYHSWSSNGKWMMYSSKQIDGRYTRLFIVHWDGERWSKPFLLPQREPRQNTLLMMAYNVAEFLIRKTK